MKYENYKNEQVVIEELSDTKLVKLYRFFTVLIRLMKDKCDKDRVAQMVVIKDDILKEIKSRKIVMYKFK